MSQRKTKGQVKMHGYIEELLKNQRFLDHIDYLKIYFKNKTYTSHEEQHWDHIDKLYRACSTYNLPPYPGRVLLRKLIQGRKINRSDIDFDVCRVRALSYHEKTTIETEAEYNISYPVSICISRYATIDEIKDFLDKHKKMIRLLLRDYQNSENVIKHYKRRNALVTARNDFIFKNSDKTRKELASLVADNFGQIMSYDDIGKVIQREKKRRRV